MVRWNIHICISICCSSAFSALRPTTCSWRANNEIEFISHWTHLRLFDHRKGESARGLHSSGLSVFCGRTLKLTKIIIKIIIPTKNYLLRGSHFQKIRSIHLLFSSCLQDLHSKFNSNSVRSLAQILYLSFIFRKCARDSNSFVERNALNTKLIRYLQCAGQSGGVITNTGCIDWLLQYR